MGTPRHVESTPMKRVPFDGYHPDGPMPSRKRRRRKKGPDPDSHVRMYLALGLIVILVIYGGIWVKFELFGKKSKAPAPVQKASTEETLDETPPPPVPVNVYDLIQDIGHTERLMDNAARLSEREDYAGAIKELNVALEKLPSHHDSLIALAKNHYLAKEYDPAISALYKALSGNPDDVPARLLLGQALGKSKRYNEAIEIAGWALKGDPYLSDAHMLAAMSHKAVGEKLSSISHLRKAYNMNSEDAFIGNELALAYADTGNFSRALQIFESLMAQSRVDSVTFFNLATCYAQKNMPEEVVSTLLEAGERFGTDYISSWIRSEKFDPVRKDPDFEELLTVVNGIPVTDPPPSS